MPHFCGKVGHFTQFYSSLDSTESSGILMSEEAVLNVSNRDLRKAGHGLSSKNG